MSEIPLFYIIAGEASGDWLGATLMRALFRLSGGKVRFKGIGGPRMRSEGIDLLFPQEELATMGLVEVIRHIPHLLRRINQTVRSIESVRPAALITIDSPDFCFRVAKKIKGKGIPLIHYVAPSVWAWRPGRAKKIAKFLDHLLAILPFEPPYFTKEGLSCTFVGHPVIESGVENGDPYRFRDHHKLNSDSILISLLPGSRRSELKRLMPVFHQTVINISSKLPNISVVIPTIPSLKDYLINYVKGWPCPVCVVDTDKDKYDAFAASRAALACSGTVTLELAMARVPFVVAYKTGKITGFFARRLVKVKFITLINIMLNKMLVPECLLERCTPEILTENLLEILENELMREQQIAGMSTVADWFGRGHFYPSEKAASVVMEYLKISPMVEVA